MMRPVQQTAATVLGWLDEGRDFAAGTLVAVGVNSATFAPPLSIQRPSF